jgi:hypothetical protein
VSPQEWHKLAGAVLYDVVLVDNFELFFNHCEPPSTQPFTPIEIDTTLHTEHPLTPKRNFLARTSAIHFAFPKPIRRLYLGILASGDFEPLPITTKVEDFFEPENGTPMEGLLNGLSTALGASRHETEPKFLGQVNRISSGAWGIPKWIAWIDRAAYMRVNYNHPVVDLCQTHYESLIKYIRPKVYCQYVSGAPLRVAHIVENTDGVPTITNHHLDLLLGHVKSHRALPLASGRINRIFIHDQSIFHGLPPKSHLRHIVQSLRYWTDTWRGTTPSPIPTYQPVDDRWLNQKPLKHSTQVEI